MKKIFFLFVLICLATKSYSQQRIISGYVTDSINGESLIGASILIKGKHQGVVSNAYGFYNIQIDTQKEALLEFSYVGYQTKEISLSYLIKGETNVKLLPNARINEVQIVGTQRSETGIGISNTTIIPKSLKSLPAIAGETDLMHYIKILPGVQSDEGSSSLSVRGGLEDQNVILMDDSPVYNVNHFGGIFSIFNTDIVQYAKFYKGAFPAYLGGRLSSVTDIRLKDGSLQNFQVMGTLGLLSSKVAVNGPIIKNRSSFLVSARTCMLPLYSPLFSTNMSYGFYDFNFKLNYILSKRDRLYFSVYKGQDNQNIYTPFEANQNTVIEELNSWGNDIISARWNHVYSSRFFTNLTLAYSNYNLKIDNKSETVIDTSNYLYNNYFHSSIETYSATLNLDYLLGKGSTIKGQAKLQQNNSIPSYQVYETISDYATSHGKTGGEIISGKEAILALNHLWETNKLTLNSGLRYTYYLTGNSFYQNLEPRIALSLNLPKSIKFLFAYDKMGQFIHKVSSNTIGLPIDYWLPITTLIPPKTGWQVIAGLSQKFSDEISIKLETYYNEGNNYLSFDEGKTIFGYTGNWENIIHTNGSGKSKGIELSVEINKNRYSGAVYSTLAKTDYQFEEINNGNPFASDYDRRFSLNTYHIYKISKKWSASLQWQFGTGLPVTLPESIYPAPQFIQNNSGSNWMPVYTYVKDEIIVFSDKNKYRMEPFHRLDIAFVWNKQGLKGDHSLNFSVFNVYGRINPYYYYIKEEHELENYQIQSARLMVYKQGLVPFLPSISYSFNFGK
ncbi:MAG: TonB-dependent receptor [Bacteroidales bacterium]|nr:TonB-dependent receptor [Bacteroidales bacterium]MBN2820691.1 TonB-dependent receptor [Bacteroidales bacterium]